MTIKDKIINIIIKELTTPDEQSEKIHEIYKQELKKQLSLNSVSNRRELLINLVKYIESYPMSTNILDHAKFIDIYISTNLKYKSYE